MIKDLDLLPNAYEMSESSDKFKVTSKGLEDIVGRVRTRTGLSEIESEFLVTSFFQEIRNSILRGEIVSLENLGTFLVVSPKVSNSKRYIFPFFKVAKNLIKKLNS